jgi:hypothetical protein
MQKTELNDDVDMRFSDVGDWHLDIWLPAGAKMIKIHYQIKKAAPFQRRLKHERILIN